MPSITEPSPQERLANSRKAIVKHMNRNHLDTEDAGNYGEDGSRQSGPVSDGALGVVKQAVRVWWHHHPASSAVDLARPLLGEYARAHPFKLLAVSAGLGAALVLVRPWRMVSLGGVLLATLKSSGLSGALLSMLSTHPKHSDNSSEKQ